MVIIRVLLMVLYRMLMEVMMMKIRKLLLMRFFWIMFVLFFGDLGGFIFVSILCGIVGNVLVIVVFVFNK